MKQDFKKSIYVAFDTETTGLAPQVSNVVEIAGVRFTGEGDEISRFSTLANPGGPMSAEVVKIHGISDAMVERAPHPAEACRQFASWLQEDDILVAHNAAFDVAFISTELTRGSLPCPHNRVLDTLRLARSLDLPIPNYRLGSLVAHFDFPETGYHRAMEDSLYVMQLMAKMIGMFEGRDLDKFISRGTVTSLHDLTPAAGGLPARFEKLPYLINHGKVLMMRYEGESGGPQRIRPLTLCTIKGKDFLMAQCMIDGGVKQFQLDRVIDLVESNGDSSIRRA